MEWLLYWMKAWLVDQFGAWGLTQKQCFSIFLLTNRNFVAQFDCISLIQVVKHFSIYHWLPRISASFYKVGMLRLSLKGQPWISNWRPHFKFSIWQSSQNQRSKVPFFHLCGILNDLLPVAKAQDFSANREEMAVWWTWKVLARKYHNVFNLQWSPPMIDSQRSQSQ